MRNTKLDETFMHRALDLALRGAWKVSPNPLVGAVIVRDGQIIGEGWHTAFGAPHAEREALADCNRRGETARDATVYVTLEPCCHTGKTPPCTDALIEADVACVVVGVSDPNPLVAGKGCSALEAAGIEVIKGVLEDECTRVNEAFFHFIQTGNPLVVAKFAMTLDGKVATWKHKSKWITGTAARRRVHEDRQRFSAIMVGAGTVMADNPLLTCRLEEFNEEECGTNYTDGHNTDGTCEYSTNDAVEHGAGSTDEEAIRAMRGPTRIIHDPHLHTSLDAQVITTAHEVPTIIVTSVNDETAYEPYCAHGCEIMVLPKEASESEKFNLLMEKLTDRGLDGVIIEGGPTLIGLAFDAGIVDKVHAYIAPKIFGGESAPSAVGGAGVARPDEAIILSPPLITHLGDDLLLECEVVK